MYFVIVDLIYVSLAIKTSNRFFPVPTAVTCFNLIIIRLSTIVLHPENFNNRVYIRSCHSIVFNVNSLIILRPCQHDDGYK